jgi:hypothetical protein
MRHFSKYIHVINVPFLASVYFLKEVFRVGSKPGSSRFNLFSHFHHFTAEPQRLPNFPTLLNHQVKIGYDNKPSYKLLLRIIWTAEGLTLTQVPRSGSAFMIGPYLAISPKCEDSSSPNYKLSRSEAFYFEVG